jgi:hypothetical protein
MFQFVPIKTTKQKSKIKTKNVRQIKKLSQHKVNGWNKQFNVKIQQSYQIIQHVVIHFV